MDDKTRNMIITIGSGIAKKGLTTLGSAAVAHGIINGSQTETFVSLGMALVGIAWSFWDDYGRAIVLSQLEVLKAKSLAQASKLKDAGLPQVTAMQIAMESSKVTPAEVVKTVASMPEIQANVAPPTPNPFAKTVAIMAIMIASMFLAGPHPASAQAQKRTATPAAATTDPTADAPSKPCLIPWDPLKLCGVLTGNPADDFKRVVKRIQAVGKTDMIYAALKAKNANTPASLVRLQCLNGVLDMKAKFEDDLKDASGTVVPRPDPDAITVIEETAELVDALAPQGALFTSCAGAAQLFKTSTLAAINGIVTGAVGLVAMGG